jgi:hypothetical protein
MSKKWSNQDLGTSMLIFKYHGATIINDLEIGKDKESGTSVEKLSRD